MKPKGLFTRFNLFILFLFIPLLLFSQNDKSQKVLVSDQAEKVVPGAERVLEGQDKQFPGYVKFNDKTEISVEDFEDWFKLTFDVTQDVDFEMTREKTDDLGFTNQRYRQLYKGVPIDRSEYVVHSKNDVITSYSGSAYKVPEMNVNPQLNEEKALKAALDFIGADEYYWQSDFWENDIKREKNDAFATYYPTGELLISKHAREDFILVYAFDIHASVPNIEKRVYVNANSGEILYTLPLVSNCSSPANFTSIFNGNRSIRTQDIAPDPAELYILNNDCQAAEVLVRDWGSATSTSNPSQIISLDNTWTTMDQQFGATVLWQTNESYDYFLNVHSRDSYDDSDGNVNAFVNAVFCTATNGMGDCISTTTNNASMSFSGGTMKVGLSSAGVLTNSYATLDIIGHEYAHAVTGSSSQLVYQGEPGALNESFSDIFGEMIERRTLGTNDWLIGDERDNGAIRSMSNPNNNGDPDTYLGTNWANTCGMCGDNGGVHTNSGVQNFWFFLLSEGGTGTNDNGDEYCVTGIGEVKASAIAFRNMTIKLSVNSNYAAARVGAIEAAEDLYGVGSNEAKQVMNAWYAVGVGATGDDIPPTITCPSDIVGIQCSEDVPAAYVNAAEFITAGGTLFDNCDSDVTLELTASSISNFGCTNSYVVTRTYTATDIAGNTSTCSQTLTVNDNTPPQIVLQPQDVTLQCDDIYVPPFDNAEDLFEDNCDDDLDVIGDIVVVSSFPCIYPQEFEYYFVATDDCGNQRSISWTVTYEDTEAPIASNLPVDVTLECDDLAGIQAAEDMEPSWEDNCTPTNEISIFPASSIVIDPDCPNAYIMSRSWFARDNCDNQSETVNQTITVIDTSPPEVDCPDDMKVDCDNQVPDPIDNLVDWEAAGGKAEDNCGDVIIEHISDVKSNVQCLNRYILTRTYRVSDECDNSVSCTQVIEVSDYTSPVITCAPDVTVACASEVPPIDISTVSATDNCEGEITIEHVTDRRVEKICPNQYIFDRMYKATDACGNEAFCEQRITVFDDIAPEIEWTHPLIQSVPNGSYVYVECESQDPEWAPPVIEESDALITDNCGVVDVEFIEEFRDFNCSSGGPITEVKKTWIATDLCGNQTVRYFYFRIIDTEAPILDGIPEDITVSCNTEIPEMEIKYCEGTAAEGIITVYDNCECADVEYIENILPGSCPSSYEMVRTWIATDNCGNSTSAQQSVTVVDDVSPKITMTHPHLKNIPNGGIFALQCEKFEIPDWFHNVDRSDAELSDNCTESEAISMSFKNEYVGYNQNCYENDYLERYKLTWRATDECGNSSIYWIYFDIVDVVPPRIEGVPNSVCGLERDPWEGVSVEEGCTSAEITMVESTETDPCTGAEMKIREYTAVDACGNRSTVRQKMYPDISTENVMNLREGFPYEFGDTIPYRCGRELPVWSVDDVVMEDGLCIDESSLVFNFYELSNVNCSETGFGKMFNYEWTIIDRCGNEYTERITLGITNPRSPSIYGLKPLAEVSCGEKWPDAKVKAECSVFDLKEARDTISQDEVCRANMEVRRTFSLTDNCGNTDTFIQVLSIIDDEGPVLYNVPSNTCNDTTNAEVWAIDACSGDTVEVSYAENLGEECADGSVVVLRMWTAEDQCGNQTVETRYNQMATTGDEIQLSVVNPLLQNTRHQGDLFLSCENGEYPEMSKNDVVVDGLCDLDLEMHMEKQYMDFQECSASSSWHTLVRYTWWAEDYCGRKGEYSVNVYYGDNIAPVILNEPEDITLYCGEEMPENELIVTDNCGGEVNIQEFVNQNYRLTDSSRVIRRFYFCEDECGNTTTTRQFITMMNEERYSCEIQEKGGAICNSDGYELEVTVDHGVPPYKYEWEVIYGQCDITEGQGTSNVKLSLGFNDVIIKSTVTDYNGCVTICQKRVECILQDEAEAELHTSTGGEILIYPNPVYNEFFISGISSENEEVVVKIMSLTGSVISQNSHQLQGKDLIQINTEDLKSGSYFVLVESNDQFLKREMILVVK